MSKPPAKPVPAAQETAATPAAAHAPAAGAATVAAAPAAKPQAKPPKAGSAAARAAAKAAAAAPTPVPSPSLSSGNRFMDRFAPARPSAKTNPEPMDFFTKSAAKLDPKLANAWKSKPGRELTEQELQAMPDSEYMNDKQIDFFRALLQSQKEDLLSNAGETTEHLREDTSIVPDPADRATIEEEHALELRTRDRERKLLKKIAQSLARLDSGEYGYCDETGEPIGLARLLARPTATLSLEAQQRREMKQKMFGD